MKFIYDSGEIRPSSTTDLQLSLDECLIKINNEGYFPGEDFPAYFIRYLIEELMINAHKYGNKKDSNKAVSLSARVETFPQQVICTGKRDHRGALLWSDVDTKITIQCTDEGTVPFNPRKIIDRSLPENIETTGNSRGVHTIIARADSFAVMQTSSHTTITVVFSYLRKKITTLLPAEI